MGKKLDALLGRNFKSSKFKLVANLAISRLAVLKNKRQSCCSTARSDVLQLLNLGHHERALLRVEQVIKEHNMLDALLMIEGYCHLLLERLNLLKHEKECPEELKEAISSLLFAASRCGDFPELQEMRDIFTSRFGKDFTSRAVDLRNNCGVNPKIIQKMSTRVGLENRVKVLKEIASDNNILLHLDQLPDSPPKLQEQMETDQNKSQPKLETVASSGATLPPDHAFLVSSAETEQLNNFPESMGARKRYRDVADAAQAAFESAAYAAVAARAAVQLSRAGSHNPDDDQSSSPGPRRIEVYAHKHMMFHDGEEIDSTGIMDKGIGLELERVHPTVHFDRDSEEDGEIHSERENKESKQGNNLAVKNRSVSASSSDSESGDEIMKATALTSEIRVLDKNDDETGDVKFDSETNIFASENFTTDKSSNARYEKSGNLYHSSPKKFPLRSESAMKISLGPGNPMDLEGPRLQSPVKRGERPISVRTRRAHEH